MDFNLNHITYQPSFLPSKMLKRSQKLYPTIHGKSSLETQNHLESLGMNSPQNEKFAEFLQESWKDVP